MNKYYPTLREYSGGGVILHPDTPQNIPIYCNNDVELEKQVKEMHSLGYEVLIHHDQIVAAQETLEKRYSKTRDMWI